LVPALAMAAVPLVAPWATSPARAVDPVPRPVGDSVIAFVDTGINPYHKVFRDDSPRALQHPSTYIPGYPADAEALNLTFDGTYLQNVKDDCDTWKDVKPGKLYWVPGTKIVGAISFEPPSTPTCTAAGMAGAKIIDLNGHGTMVASRGAAATAAKYGACGECRIVSVQYPGSVNLVSPGGSTEPVLAAVKWASDNASWIDAQSNSWGPIAPVYDPTGAAGLLAASPALVKQVEASSAAHLAFWASGNGAAFRYGVLGHPTLLSPHLTPSAISVGGHDSGYVNTWPGFPPKLVSDSCDSWAAYRDKVNESGDSVGGGTSAATPFVAGGAGQVLLQARQILGDPETGVASGGVVAKGAAGLVPSGPLADGVFTKDEWRDVVFKTATARPTAQYEDGPACGAGGAPYNETPVKWTDVPAQYPEYVNIGYGAVDRPSLALASKVLLGQSALPARTDTDTYFAAEGTARGALHTVFKGP
jgi:hypothetical protein